MKIYYAHPISLYGTDEEAEVISALKKRGFEVVNPSASEHQDHLPKIRAGFADPKEASRAVMDYFVALCADCPSVAFSSFPDGSLGAGVVKEVQSFLERGAPAFHVVHDEGRIMLDRVSSLKNFTCLGIDETRAMLKILSPVYRAEVEQRVKAETPKLG